MNLINLYAKILINPENFSVYRNLIDFYKSNNEQRKVEYFKEIIKQQNESNVSNTVK